LGSIDIGGLGFRFAVDFGIFRHRRGIVGKYYCRCADFDSFFMGDFRQKPVFSLSVLLIKKWLKFIALKPVRIVKWPKSI